MQKSKKITKYLTFAIIFALALSVSFSPVKASFFDDVVDFLDPTQQIGNLLDGRPQDNLPPIPGPIDIIDPACLFACDDDEGAPATTATTNQNQTQTPNPTVSISANPININYNGTSTVYWNSSNTVFCNASGGTNGWSGSKSISGTFYTGNLTNTTTYNITCTNSIGAYAVGAITIFVNNNQEQNVTVQLTVDDDNIDRNDSTVIRWSSNNATFCNASGGINGWAEGKNTSGSFYTGPLTNTRTYSITCTNNTDSASNSVTVYVDDNDDNNDNNRPDVTLRADDTRIDYNQSTVIRWDSDNADYCRASNGTNGWSDNRNRSGSFYTGRLTRDTTYRMICTNEDGSESDSITIRVDDRDNNYYNPNDNYNNDSLTATTTGATQVGSTSVQLNSIITNPGNDYVNSWFEWGRTTSLGNKTNITSLGTARSVIHKETLSGLSPGTTYYFRAVAENSAWRNNGSILSFVTSGSNQNTNTYTYITNTTTTPPASNTGTTVGNDQTLDPLGLGANVLGAGSFFPSSILGWIILIILILILLLLGKQLRRDFSVNKSEPTQGHA